MAGRGKTGRTPSEPDKGKKRRNALAKAASLAIIGGSLITSPHGSANAFELPFISVQKQHIENSDELRYQESCQIVNRLSYIPMNSVRPEFQEAYLQALMLDLDTQRNPLAITDCGQCLCSTCNATDCVACISSCNVVACDCACGACDCTTDCAAGPCNCACDCVACVSDCSSMFDCGICSSSSCGSMFCDCQCSCSCMICMNCSCSTCNCSSCSGM